MNSARRKILEDLHEKFLQLKIELEEVRDQEQEAFDNMPENMQQGAKAQEREAKVDALDDACSNMDEVLNAIEEAKN